MNLIVDYPCGALDFGGAELRKALGTGTEQVAVFSRSVELPEQGYRVSLEDGAIRIAGADTAGALYGMLDTARHFAAGVDRRTLPARTVTPYLLRRGIKFNIPLDARTPSYADAGDSAQENIAHVWDFSFWQGFLDRMALNTFNVLSLWSLSPFPSLVLIPEYPETALADVKRAGHVPRGTLRGTGLYTEEQEKTLVTVKKLSIEEKIEFWRAVMQYAADRCIDVYLFTWNLYVYGAQYGNYGITDDPGNPVSQDYIRRGTETLIRTYPLLRGIGVTAGENMRREWKIDVREDVEWVRDTYGAGIIAALKDESDRRFSLIHRAHMTGPDQMEAVFADFPHTFEMSYKYSMAHVYSAVQPCFGDAFFKSLKGGRKTWLTLRDDDFYLLPWGDADFVRDYLRGLPREAVGFYLGPDGIVWGKDYAPRDPRRSGAYFFDRHWLTFALWGRLSYDIDAPPLWKAEFGSPPVYEALTEASKALLIPQRVYWHNFDFQWYIEASASYLDEEDALIFHTLDDIIRGESCPGSGYLSIAEYCGGLLKGEPAPGITPLEAAADIERRCLRALELLEAAGPEGRADADDRGPAWADIEAMSRLGLYYAYKFRAGVSLCLYRRTQRPADQAEAVAQAEQSAANWTAYSALIAARYRPRRLGRLRNPVSPDMFDHCARFDVVIAQSL